MANVLIRRTCPQCNIRHSMEFNATGYRKFMAGASFDEAFPDCSQKERDFLTEGICPECWDEQEGLCL